MMHGAPWVWLLTISVIAILEKCFDRRLHRSPKQHCNATFVPLKSGLRLPNDSRFTCAKFVPETASHKPFYSQLPRLSLIVDHRRIGSTNV